VTATGASDVSFDEFLMLYINHRPVVGVSPAQIADAFRVLSASLGAGAGADAPAAGDPAIDREALMRALKVHGETLGPADLAQCLQALVGVSEVDQVLPDKVSGQEFAETLLGFEGFRAAVEAV
jgi:hypothetical protein